MATKIICRARDCVFWEDNICTSEEIIYDPKEGCLTYQILDDLGEEEDDELIEAEEEEEEELFWDDEKNEDLFIDNDLEAEDDDRDWRS